MDDGHKLGVREGYEDGLFVGEVDGKVEGIIVG
jgi:hypothetical protein